VRVHSGRDGSLLHVFFGAAAGNLFGHSVAGAVDINKDGYDDLIIGAPGAAAPGMDSGEVRVYSGRHGTLLYTSTGEAAGDQLGFSVSGLKDTNGDGFDEWLAGAPFHDSNGSNSGRVSLYSGFNGSRILFHDGAAAGDEFGIAVGRAGFIDGDGREDWIASAWRNDSGAPDGGRVRVISGADGSILRTETGPAAGFGLGRGGVCGLGDVDGDGFGDFLVGSPFADEEGTNSGVATVYSGQIGGGILHSFVWAEGGDLLGYSVASAGDINGDGIQDVLVGLAGADSPLPGAGEAHVYLGGCWSTSYCISTTNTSGFAGRLRMEGSNSVTTNSMSFRARGVPRNQFGTIFYGPRQIQVPLGRGYLCIGAGQAGIQRMHPIVSIGQDNMAWYRADLTRPPASSGPGMITPGSTWNFQFWFRDRINGTSTTNLTDAIEVEFCP
jgi:hypothetical protein